jgi:hypothetical protein
MALLVYRKSAKTHKNIVVWSGRTIIIFRRNLPPPSSGKKQAEMSVMIQKSTINLKLCLTQERNTENTMEGMAKKEKKILEKNKNCSPFMLQTPIYGV